MKRSAGILVLPILFFLFGTCLSTPGIAVADPGYIAGRVTAADTGSGIYTKYVVYDAYYKFMGTGSTNSNGDGYYTTANSLSLMSLPPGKYKIIFWGRSGYAGQWWSNKYNFGAANRITVVSGMTTNNINVQIIKGGTITGKVTDANANPIQNISVNAYDPQNDWYGSSLTDVSGVYSITGLPSGNYRVQFGEESFWDLSSYVIQFWGQNRTLQGDGTISVIAGQTTSGIDAQLQTGGALSWTITKKDGTPIQYAEICGYNTAKDKISCGRTGADGVSQLLKIPFNEPVKYEISASEYATQWSSGKRTFETADALTLPQPGTNSLLAPQDQVVELAPEGKISGRVTDPAGNDLSPIRVWAFDENQNKITSSQTYLGTYTISKLSPGPIKVFFDRYYYAQYGSQWWNHAASFPAAGTIDLAEGQTVTGIDAQLDYLLYLPLVLKN